MPIKKSNAAAVLVASAALVGGGVAIASASTDDTSNTTVPSAGATDKSTYGAPEGRGGGAHTEVTGAEKTKVIDAVQAAHDGATITDVRQDADGSYDALGTQEDGTPVKYDVSADLTTITEHTPGHGGRGGAGGEHTEVSGAEKTKVVDAVQAAHDGVTITDVRQDADGSYDALGTQEDETPVKYDVSADLETITEHTRGPGGHRGHGGPGGEDRPGQDGATGAPSDSTSLNS